MNCVRKYLILKKGCLYTSLINVTQKYNKVSFFKSVNETPLIVVVYKQQIYLLKYH